MSQLVIAKEAERIRAARVNAIANKYGNRHERRRRKRLQVGQKPSSKKT